VKKNHDQKYADRPNPGGNAAVPVLLRQLAGLKEECPESAKDLSIDVKELMDQIVKEMPDSRWITNTLGLPTSCAINTVPCLAAIAASDAE
jgi:hypothetical protein